MLLPDNLHLAADVGGTKTLLGLFTQQGDPHQPVETRSIPTHDHGSLEELVGEFLGDRRVSAATFAVAGAVIEGVVRGSNLPWVVTQGSLAELLAAPVALINDLEAIAGAVPYLLPEELVTLAAGIPDTHGAIGVIAPGTGLGQAMLFRVGDRHHPMPSEAGHIDFAPSDELEDEYLGFLRSRFGHVSLERACSGVGFQLLAQFLRESRRAHPSAQVAAALDTVEDATPIIVDAGLAASCPLATLALETFVSMLGAAAGNLALQIVATGGIYLGGGIPPRILPALRHPRFLDAFRNKGRFAQLLERIPVHVIATPASGLYGAARHALVAGNRPLDRV